MSKNVKGSFYLKQIVNGNLVGEFSPNDCEFIFTVNADFKGYSDLKEEEKFDQTIGKFRGSYISTWQEDNNVAYLSELKIIPFGILKYKLEWEDKNINTNKYIGTGMLCGDILIGNYESF